MREYQKIETLYKFNNVTKRFTREFYNPIVEYLKDCAWIVSEKIDGTNIRVHWDGHRVEWSGRTDASQLPKEVEALLQETFGESEIIFEQNFGEKEVFLFMECYGGKIQGGLYGGKERLIGFDVMIGTTYLDKMIIKDIFDKFGVETVRFSKVDNLQEAIDFVRLNKAPSEHCDTRMNEIEGLVCVPAMRLYDHQGKRIIVKIKKKDLEKLEDIDWNLN